ncbi:ABC transporter permease [Anaeromicropila herbilytica]|uniref:ABC3 transporter permease C-terminal domain-containing protein n=1 Tax=Anaeromicropila herbilytica TaxID=2785025 RepID=A0A7R7IDE8_9FIRM|nr:ABC transporter permease [Anaeromicropila herbilytica]BCN29948.1 hypothetical protein bsdtb5_12430 [Anaeromicropila herbilytica]
MAILTIIRSNLKRKKGSILSIFLLVFIIALSLTTIISVNIGVTKGVEESCNYSNVPDMASFILKDKYNQQTVEQLQKEKEVKHIEVVDSIVSDYFSLNGKSASSSVYFVSYQPDAHPYHFFTKDGLTYKKDNLTEPKKGEIYVPIAFQNMYHCNIGDTAQIKTPKGIEKFRIAEFIEEPFIGASMLGFKMLMINQTDLLELTNQADGKKLLNSKIMNLYLKDSYKNQAYELKKQLNDKTGFINMSMYTLLKEEANSYTLLFTKVLSGILWAFAILLFVVTLMIIGHNVSTNIEMEYVSFGILKSQGFTSLQIRIILLLQYMLASILAIISGMLLSKIGIVQINRIFIPVNGLLVSNQIRVKESIGVLLVFVIIIAFYIQIKSRKVLKISPVQAISLGHEPVYFASHIDFSITKEIPMPLGTRLILKNLVGNMKRYISTILIMIILTFFAITITSLQQMSSDDNVDVIFGSIGSDISINYSKDTEQSKIDEIINYIRSKTKITKEFQITNRYLTLDGGEYLGHFISDTKNVIYPLEGRVPKYKNEIIVTDILSKLLKKTVGDKVKIQSGSKKAEYMIVGIYQNTSDAGKNFTMLLSGMKRINPKFAIHSVDIGISDRKQSKELVSHLKEQYKSEKDQLAFHDSNAEGDESNHTVILAINAVTAITYVLTIIFVAVVSFLLCHKMFRLEQVDLGIYKSLGFTTKSLRRQFTIRFVIVTLIGSIIGMLLNFLGNNQLMSILLRNMGISHYVTKYTMANLLIPILCVCGFTALFSYMISGKMKRVSPKNLIQE